MIVKTYSDGSELTVGMLAAGTVVGALLGATIFGVTVKVGNWSEKRNMKKYGWPQSHIDRI